MSRFSFEYEFDEVQLPEFGKGMFIDGTATLSDDDGDGQFYVSAITLDGHELVMTPGVVTFEGELFKKISAVIYASDHAASEYADAWNESRQPDPDRARDERRDHEAMGWM